MRDMCLASIIIMLKIVIIEYIINKDCISFQDSKVIYKSYQQ